MKIKEIQEKFNRVLSYSQEGVPENPKTDEIFDRWYKAKERFLDYFPFNEDFIYEYPEELTFDLDDELKKNNVNKLLNKLDLTCYDYRCLNRRYLKSFISANTDNFYTNIVKEDFYIPDTDICIKKGTKIIRSFKHFFENKELLNEAQSKASILIQEDKFKGKFCISINPIDFLSASETTYSWRSCHALDGEYRAGNISYMLDETTVMCYIKGEGEKILPDFPEDVPWNSKKWRMWLFLSDTMDMVFAGRQYPFSLGNQILDFIKTNILKDVGKFSLPWYDKRIKEFEIDENLTIDYESPLIPLPTGLLPIGNLVEDAAGSLHYNDLLYSSYYIPKYTYKINKYYDNYFYDNFLSSTNRKIIFNHRKTVPHFKLGGQFDCVRCGSAPVTLSETFLCNDCELHYGAAEGDMFRTCDYCGQRYIDEEGGYVSGEDADVCPDCMNNIENCSRCGQSYYEDNLIWLEEEGCYICKWCAEEN